MIKEESNAYILGTDDEELHRLGLQHQVWATEAQLGWQNAGITEGQTILDLGCGPGFCTTELAFLSGHSGYVIGIDRSEHFIKVLDRLKELHKLPIQTYCTDFDEMDLHPSSIDRMFCRWALAWIDNPEEILSKVFNALKPGGKMVIHEYFDWSTLQIEPSKNALETAIKGCLQSFEDGPGFIDIGRRLPAILHSLGMENIEIRLINKMAKPSDTAWQWPRSFFKSYFPRLVQMKYLSEKQSQDALEEMEALAKNEQAVICCPIVAEVIATKS